MDLSNITLGGLATALAFIVALCGSIAYVLKPVKLLDNRLKTIEQRLDGIEEHLDNDNRKLKKFDEDIKVVFRNQLLVMDHDIYDNHIEELKSAKEETKDYIIKR